MINDSIRHPRRYCNLALALSICTEINTDDVLTGFRRAISFCVAVCMNINQPPRNRRECEREVILFGRYPVRWLVHHQGLINLQTAVAAATVKL